MCSVDQAKPWTDLDIRLKGDGLEFEDGPMLKHTNGSTGFANLISKQFHGIVSRSEVEHYIFIYINHTCS